MKINKITYSRTKRLNNGELERIEVTADLEEGEDANLYWVIDELRDIVSGELQITRKKEPEQKPEGKDTDEPWDEILF